MFASLSISAIISLFSYYNACSPAVLRPKHNPSRPEPAALKTRRPRAEIRPDLHRPHVQGALPQDPRRLAEARHHPLREHLPAPRRQGPALRRGGIYPSEPPFHVDSARSFQLFEGLKAYRGVDGKVRIFRPELNMQRMNMSALKAGLPTFDGGEFLKCLNRLISVDQEWVPHSTSASLYIRPTLIGIDVSRFFYMYFIEDSFFFVCVVLCNFYRTALLCSFYLSSPRPSCI